MVRRVVVGVAVAALVAWAFGRHWHVLAASPFPIGVDGYFYPIQVRSLLEHATLQYPASPLTFWWMAPFAAATDPITGAKLGAALGAALIAIPAYGVGARLGRGAGAGLGAAAIAATSAGSAYLTIEFVKQGIGLTVALAALWLVLRAVETPSRSRLVAAGAGLVAALLAHVTAGALVVAIAVPAAFEEARGRGALRGRRLLYVLAAAPVIVGVLVVVVLQRLPTANDIALVGELVSGHARWDAPALATPYLKLDFDHEALIGGVVAIGAAIVLVTRREAAGWSPGERAAAWVIIGFGVLLGLPWLAVTDPQGLGFRLRIAAFVPMALNVAIVVTALPRAWHRDAMGVAVIVVLAVAHPRDRGDGLILAHPALVAATMALDGQVPSNATVIVPERHVAYMVAWYTRAPVSLRPERVPYAQRVRLLLPLSPASAGWPLEAALDAARREPTLVAPLGLHPRHRNGLVLVVEPTWDWILDHLPPRARKHFAAWPTI